MYRIIPFEDSYRDDMIFCFLSALDALGRKPRLNEDLLDIPKHYFANGDMFWVAVDGCGRVVGMIGTKTVSGGEMWLKRLFIKPTVKRNGLGSALLLKAEEFAGARGIKTIHTRFGEDFTDAPLFYGAKGFVVHKRDRGMHYLVKDMRPVK